MIRKGLSEVFRESGFRWRGHEVTRLEGFSDAVFAFAVTLLVVSLEVPKSYAELIVAIRSFPVFGICFALLAVVWYEHCRYFRRYGLETPTAVVLNCTLLFFVLFYVYPLKFVFTAAIAHTQYTDHQIRMIYTIFSSGFAAVFAVFGLMYLHAWRQRKNLELTELEQLRTRRSVIDQCAMVMLGIISILVARLSPLPGVAFSGLIYSVIPVYYTIAGRLWGRRERLLLTRA